MKKVAVLFVLVVLFCGCSTEKLENTQVNTVNIQQSQDENSGADTQNGTISKGSNNISQNIAAIYCGEPVKETEHLINKDTITNEQKEYINSKYQREFDLYANGKHIGKAKGEISWIYDNYWNVEFNQNYEVALSKVSNPYPRPIIYKKSDFLKEYDSVLKIINGSNSVNATILQTCDVDLDGDGTLEHLIYVADVKDYFIAKCLLDSNYKIVAYLTLVKEKPENYSQQKGIGTFEQNIDDGYFEPSSEIIDINNDNVMELLVTQPYYETFKYNCFTYKNGDFDGPYITKSSYLP